MANPDNNFKPGASGDDNGFLYWNTLQKDIEIMAACISALDSGIPSDIVVSGINHQWNRLKESMAVFVSQNSSFKLLLSNE